jgi:two-component system, LytTR family, response regulator
MNCIVVDDEPLARQGMEMYIAQVSSLQWTGSFSNAMAAGNFLRSNPVGLMFLDINMPELSGLDFLKSLKEAPLVIFTTAYPQYALESYELEAIDYLVKPIRIERFLKAVNKAENHSRLLQQERNQVEKIENDFVFIKSDRKYVKIHFKDILYIEGLKDYTVLYTSDSNKFIASMNVKTIASQLPVAFFARVSKSYIVNVNHIDSFDNELIYIQNNEIPLGQGYKEEFIKEYIEKKIVKR